MHILTSGLYPNPIIPTFLIPKSVGSCASCPMDVVIIGFLECQNRDFELR